MTTTSRNKIAAAVDAASKLRLMEEEVGKFVAPHIEDRNLVYEIADRSGMRASVLVELGKVALGRKKRHKQVPELKKTG